MPEMKVIGLLLLIAVALCAAYEIGYNAGLRWCSKQLDQVLDKRRE